MADDQKSSQGNTSSYEEKMKSLQNTKIDEATQTMLNKPWSDASTSLSSDDKSFLEMLVKHIESGEIKLHTPSSIINQTTYDQLNGEQKAKTELWINATIALIRQVNDFYHSEFNNNSDMMISMVKELRAKKETLEKEIGDVLKI